MYNTKIKELKNGNSMKIDDYNWVLLRGLSTEKRQWDNFPKIMKKSVKTRDIMTIDLVGAGDKNHLKAPVTVKGQVKVLRAEFLERKKDGNYAILALSLGAMIAMKWLEMHPEDFEKGVFLNTSSKKLNPAYKRANPLGLKFFLEVFAKGKAEDQIKHILDFTTNITGDKSRLVRDFTKHYEERPISKENQVRQLLSATQFVAPKTLPHRLLFLSGGHDRLVNPDCSMTLSRHFKAPLSVHPTAGHDLPLDAPDWIITQIKHWIKGAL